MKAATALCIMIAIAVPAIAAAFSYDDYAAVLKARVNDAGLVDYAGLAESPQRLERFNAALAALSWDTYDGWSDDAQIAFWINAYNALTLQLIIDNYPIEGETGSIQEIPGAWDTVTFPVMGEDMTLDHIEHGILREDFDEPRIHMALVCAAVSCPPLRREPYRGETLDARLDDQARRFLASPRGLVIDRGAPGGAVVRLSSIFDWFADDFVEQYGGEAGGTDGALEAVLDFVAEYAPPAQRRFLETGEFEVEYLEYDWTLNEQAK